MVLKVIWDQMKIFVAKQGVIMNHWGSVGVIGRSVGLTGVMEAQWGSSGVSEAK